MKRPLEQTHDREGAENSMFETQDMHLAAFLLSQGCEALPPRIIDARRVTFAFSDQIRCQSLALQFVQGRATVEARQFLEAQGRARDLRDLALGSTPRRNNP